jgi:hypothetical protein
MHDERAAALGVWLETWKQHVSSAAASCVAGGDANWDAVLRELGVTALSAEERRHQLAGGPKRNAGALPIEVRWAMEAIEARARIDLRSLDRDQHVADEVLERIERSLVGMVDGVVREHLRLTTPAPTTSSIFANARASTPDYAKMGTLASMGTMKCTTCGSPRKREGDLKPCPYCGGVLA